MFTYDYSRPALTVDVVILQLQDNKPHVLLIQRAQPPFEGYWALPGGFVNMEESLENAAARELTEETGLKCVELEQFHTYGDPHRDPRGRVISVAYCTVLQSETIISIRGGGDAKEARWYPLADLPELAFDHRQIIQDAYDWVYDRIRE